DANQGYNTDMLIKFFRQTKEDEIELIEQPVPANAINELKNLPDQVKKIIAVDESLIDPSDAFTLASGSRASDIYNIKLMKSGGIFPAGRIASIAQAANIDLMWGCNDESSISITAALHSALSFSNTKYLDLDGSLDLVVDVVNAGFEIKDGWMSVTGRSGLGVN
ncbi:MAG: enolase C-terminal domain-like protein, partial [Bacteroidota bacterium]